VHALRRVHEALVPGGILLDLMPFEPWVPVESRGGVVGHVDTREFARDVVKTEARLASVVREGLFALERELRFDVLEHFDSADRLLEVVGEWGRTRIPARLRARLARAEPPFRVRERLVLRRLRALVPGDQ
jgi:hypothetical protein